MTTYRCPKRGALGSVDLVLFTTVERICPNPSCGSPVVEVVTAAPVEPNSQLDQAIKKTKRDLARGMP